MGRYIIRRMLQFIPVFFVTTFMIFLMVYAMPGDPIRALAGDRQMSASTLEALRERYNLNDPFVVQYGKYMKGIFGFLWLDGDLGTDFRGQPVTEKLAAKLPITIRLALMAFGFEVVIGILAGILAGVRQKGFVDNLVLVSTLVVIAIPIFVLGFIAQYMLGVRFGIMPISYNARDPLFSLLMPSLVLGSVSLAYIARLTRTSLVENLRGDYVRTATSKGLSRRRVVGIHTLRNSMIPVVTFLAIDLGALMGGAIITETIFNVPGIGREIYDSVTHQENAVVVGIVTFMVIVYMLANLVVDVLYAVLDPRIRYD